MAEDEDPRQRVRSYLVAQANKLSIPELVEKLRRDAAPLKEALEAVPSERLHEKPAPDEWSAAEVFAHILDTSERSARTILKVIAGDEYKKRFTDQISDVSGANLNASDYWTAFQSERENFYAKVAQADGNENLDAKIEHPLFGPLNWREWMLFMRVHDIDHLGQIRSIAQHFSRK